MQDKNKTSNQLISELEKLRQRNAELETLEVRHGQEMKILLEELEQFRSLVESGYDFIWEVNQDGIFTYLSPHIKELLGYEPGEILGKTPFDLMPPDEAARLTSVFKTISEAGKPIERLENVNLHKDGRQVVLETNGVPILDAGGNLLGYRGIDRDITERKKMEEALELERDKLELLIDGISRAGIGIDIVGDDYTVLFQSRNLRERFGESKGKYCYEYYRGLNKPCDFCPAKQSIHNNTVERIEINGADGKCYEIFTAPLPEPDGSIHKAIEILLDITKRKQSEEELRKTKDHLENIIESSSDCIVVTDAGGYIVRVNSSFMKLLGYEEDEVIGKHTAELSPAEDGMYESATGDTIEIEMESYAQSQVTLMERLYENGTISNVETYYIRKDGKLVSIEVNSALLYNEKGDITGAVGINRDITERNNIEREVRESRDFLENIFRTSADGIVITTGRGVITQVNEALENMLGYSSDELVGKYIAELSPVEADYYDYGKEYVTKIFEEGIVVGAVFNWLRKDGSVINVELNSSLLKDNEGNVTGAVASIRDVTERKHREEDFIKIKTALDSASDAIGMTDVNLKIIYQNQAFLDLFGYTVEEIEKMDIADAYRDADFAKKRMQALKDGKAWEGEVQIRSKDGSDPFCFLSASPIFDDTGNIIGCFSRHTDITERKKMEQRILQSEKLKSLGELAGGVAHDFNNVLAAVLGNVQLLKMRLEAPRGVEERRKAMRQLNEGLSIIEKAANDGAETVRRIQDFARRRDEDKYFSTVNINELIDDAFDFTRMRWKDDAESKGIRINMQKEFSSLPLTAGSGAELREVMVNLINNALDAIPQGGMIKIKTYKEDNHIFIEVEDTGDGIPIDIRDRMFDPFFTTKGVQSSGLGLSVSYGIINRHSGTISVDSLDGGGTTFTIKLPIMDRVIEEEDKKEKPIEGKHRKAKVLVIEDEEDVRNVLSVILEEGGHEVETAGNGIQGMEMFEREKFDLVLTDLGMPGMSGWQVAEKIKSINKKVPVALITGWNIDLKESELQKNGVDLVVQKPFKVKQVLRLVQEGMILRDRFKEA
jgi:PAS domain S-box-containing protein